jgi:predicted kinase
MEKQGMCNHQIIRIAITNVHHIIHHCWPGFSIARNVDFTGLLGLIESDSEMNLILLSGPPASGKTTLREKLVKRGTIISPDNFIGYTKEKPWTPKVAREAWKKADILLKEALNRGDRVIVFDATFVSPKKRKKYIKLGKSHDATVICVYCVASKKTVLERNANRDEFRKVPGFIVGKMVNSFVVPEKEEGFDLIVKYDSESDEFNGDFVKVSELLEVD